MTYQSIFFDFDLDGDADLFTANDKWQTHNSFFSNNGDGTFTDVTFEYGLGSYMEGMGVSIGDFDFNGYFDLFVANATSSDTTLDTGNKLYLNQGNGVWNDISESLGIQVHETVWGANLVDIDNDQDLDLFCVASGAAIEDSQQLFINEGGDMVRADNNQIQAISGRSYGTALGDLNDDGYYDIVVANSDQGHHQIWMNQTENDNNFIKFNLEGVISNRDAIGALVEVWTDGLKQIRYTTCGNSYASQNSDTYIVGLAQHQSADSLIVNWPSGYQNAVYELLPNRRYDILEDTTNYIIDCTPDAGFSIESLSGNDFLFTVDSPNSDEQYLWQLNGLEYEGDDVEVIDLEPGAYEVCLIATNNCSWNTQCLEFTVECSDPVADITWESEELLLYLVDASSGAESSEWTIDGEPVFPVGGIIELDSSGAYTLCLEVSNPCGTDEVCSVIEVSCTLPEASMVLESELLAIYFENQSIETDSIIWDFGDGNTSEVEFGSHQYSQPGEYEVCLYAFNECGVDTLCEVLEITCPLPNSDFILEIDSMTVFLLPDDNDVDSVHWYPGDGTQLTGQYLSYDYTVEGEYEICLVAFNECGQDSTCQSVLISDGIVGLIELDENTFHVFPNPVDEVLYISPSEVSTERVEIELLNPLGVLIYHGNLSSSDRVSIDLSQYVSGRYILRLSSGRSSVTKVIVKH